MDLRSADKFSPFHYSFRVIGCFVFEFNKISSLTWCISSSAPPFCKNFNVTKKMDCRENPWEICLPKVIKWIHGQPKVEYTSLSMWILKKIITMKWVMGNVILFAKKIKFKLVCWCLVWVFLFVEPARPSILRAVKSILPHDSLFNLQNSSKWRETTDIECTIFHISTSLETIKNVHQ